MLSESSVQQNDEKPLEAGGKGKQKEAQDPPQLALQDARGRH